MRIYDSEVWLRLYMALLKSGKLTPAEASDGADEALLEYRQRFPPGKLGAHDQYEVKR